VCSPEELLSEIGVALHAGLMKGVAEGNGAPIVPAVVHLLDRGVRPTLLSHPMASASLIFTAMNRPTAGTELRSCRLLEVSPK
jgi:hypothetical protein